MTWSLSYSACAGALKASSLVVCLPRSPGYKLNRDGNPLVVTMIIENQMDFIEGHRVVENHKSIPFARLIQLLQPTVTIFCELEQKFPIVTSMGHVPDPTWGKMPMRPGHLSLLFGRLGLQKTQYSRILIPLLVFTFCIKRLEWLDPIETFQEL